MGVFNQRSKIKPAAHPIRVEQVPINPKPKPKSQPPAHKSGSRSSGGGPTPSSSSAHGSAKRPVGSSSRVSGGGAGSGSRHGSASPYPSGTPAEERSRKRKAVGSSSRSPTSEIKFSDDSESEDGGAWAEIVGARKRRRYQDARREVDVNRKLKHPKLWTGQQTAGEEKLAIIHAADVASVKEKCEPALGISPEDVAVGLRYPGVRQKERYER